MSSSVGRLEWSEDRNMFTSQPIHVNRNPVLCIFSAYMHMHGMLNVQEIWICIFWPRTFGDRWDCRVNWVHEALQIQVYQEHEKPEQMKMLNILGSSKKWGNQPGSSSLRKTRRVSNCGWWAGKRLPRFVFVLSSSKTTGLLSAAHLWTHILGGWIWGNSRSLFRVTCHQPPLIFFAASLSWYWWPQYFLQLLLYDPVGRSAWCSHHRPLVQGVEAQ